MKQFYEILENILEIKINILFIIKNQKKVNYDHPHLQLFRKKPC